MAGRSWKLAGAVAGWWTLEGLTTAGQLLTMQGAGGEVLALHEALARGLFSAWLWIPWALGLFWCVERFPFERGGRARSLGVLVTAVLGVVLVRALTIWGLNPWLGWYRELPPFREVLITSVWNNFLFAWVIIGVAHAWLLTRRAQQRQQQAEQLQARLVEARLEALSAQLDPHFLFNALNSIAEMVHRDADAADRMLVGVGELLRSSLDHRQRRVVPLREELRLLQHYLGIEKVRLGERLQLAWDVGPGLDGALVPPLVLQPLAENAIRHALAERLTPGRLEVQVRRDGGWLLLSVKDDGGGAKAAGAGHGVGLANIRSRLECLYGQEHALALERCEDGGTCARLRVPLRLAPARQVAA
jgi:signal transduction histidine kinase